MHLLRSLNINKLSFSSFLPWNAKEPTGVINSKSRTDTAQTACKRCRLSGEHAKKKASFGYDYESVVAFCNAQILQPFIF
jgi:hypothetical protein